MALAKGRRDEAAEAVWEGGRSYMRNVYAGTGLERLPRYVQPKLSVSESLRLALLSENRRATMRDRIAMV